MSRLSQCKTCTAVVIAALTWGCGGAKDATTSPDQTGLRAQIIGVSSATGAVATLKSGSVPGGSSIEVNGPGALTVVNGGTSVIVITSSTTFYRVAVAINGESDYYELVLPTGATSLQLLVSLAQSLTSGSLPIAVSAGDANGQFGPAKVMYAALTQVGTGDVQVSLSWDGPSDVDLHVVGPDNEEIYYGNRTSTSGGVLDLDSNAACNIDNVDNENVTWPTGRSPSGAYTVRVDYWSSCGRAITNYAVTVSVAGRTPQVFIGSLTGAGDYGGLGSGRTITTFSR